ncbi:MAG: amino acid ABC transporter substrate-binding protein, partial [Amphritea sp.]|nr:amino acid ABC transporter substrate-binding protein [Amphritea sp.]
RAQGITYTPVVFDTNDQAAQAFDSGRCDSFTTDLSQAAGLRTRMQDPSSVGALPEVISKEPLGPVVRQGDDTWFNIVKWSHNAMLNAEELGITSANVDKMKAESTNPNVKRLVGLDGPKGKGMDLPDDWAYQIVKQVGNYGEAYERNVGKGSPLGLERGLNALWNQGGLQYAPPMR